jgi:alpha-pyrone synthase
MLPAIIGLGTANPAFKRQQSTAADLVAEILALPLRQKKILRSIYNSSGIETRYSVLSDYVKPYGEFEFFPNNDQDYFPSTAQRMQLYKTNALPLALNAINDCLAMLKNYDTNRITHLITVSCTGMYAPGLDIEIAQALNLKSDLKRTCIYFMGCYAAFNALKVADAFCRADPDANVLIVCVELCTLHFQKNASLDNIISNAIFADGAAAVLVTGNPDTDKYFSMTNFHSELIPQTAHEMVWDIGNYGFEIVLSNYVPKVIKDGMQSLLKNLSQQASSLSQKFDYYAIHPGGMKILQACEAAINLTNFDNRFSYSVLKQYGNMSSATVLFVLKEIWQTLTTADMGKTIFSCAFGPGLTLEAIKMEIYAAS